jgi:hypothetical protein
LEHVTHQSGFAGDLLIFQVNIAGGGGQQTGNGIKQCALAATTGPQNAHKLPPFTSKLMSCSTYITLLPSVG